MEDVLKKLPMGPAMPRELIRKACEPFFEEMLTALQEGLQTQLHPGNKLADIAEAMIYHANSSYQMQKAEDSFRSRFNCPSGQHKQVLDDDSTEAEDLGAFASLLSASEGESVDGNDAPSPNTEISAGQDFELASEADKSTMVCRHWKTKGWCRLESNCKFLHPEHKRGIAAPKFAGAKGTSGGISQTDISTSFGAVPGHEGDATAVTRRRKRGGKNRSNKNQSVQLGNMEEGFAFVQAQYPPLGGLVFCAPCFSTV